jgi:hypothetical protein
MWKKGLIFDVWEMLGYRTNLGFVYLRQQFIWGKPAGFDALFTSHGVSIRPVRTFSGYE